MSKLIDQNIIFVLLYGNDAKLAVYRTDIVLMSETKSLIEWKLNINGLDLEAVWENVIARIAGINLVSGKSLDATIIEYNCQCKLIKSNSRIGKESNDRATATQKVGSC